MNNHSTASNRIRAALPGLALFFAVAVVLSMIGCSSTSVTPREGSISGRIISVAGTPVEDALVSWAYDRTRWCLTDENGSYYIEGIGFGDQNFLVEAFGYRTAMFSAAVYSGQSTTAGEVKIEAKSFDFSEIAVEEVSATHAIVSWKTTDYTNGLIEYGDSDALGRYVREESGVYATTHSLKITGLTAAKTWYFRIVANREGRAAETSALQTLNTLSTLEDRNPPTPPANVEAALSGVPGQVTVFWAASGESDLKGYCVYRSETANGVFAKVSNVLIARGQERFTDNTVLAGKKYYYRVTALDQANNESGFNNVAAMVVPGTVSTEVRWLRANSPYHVDGDITVSETGRLIIDPGVEVLIADTDGLRSGNQNLVEFNISGALIASAGEGLPIVFASARINPEKEQWQGLVFDGDEDGSSALVNVSVSDAVTGVHIKKSAGIFSQISVSNCTTAVVCENSTGLKVNSLTTQRCPTGMELRGNSGLVVSDSSFLHPQTAINSHDNSGLTVSGCNFIEYTETGLLSNESGGIVEVTNNLFVSPLGLGLKILRQNPLVEYNTFDSPYAIQITTGNPVIRKNLIMAARSAFSDGRKGIENLSGAQPAPRFGPNNMTGFAAEVAYIGCEATADSTSESLLLMKDLSGDLYDYRLRQAYPDLSDPWGIRRTTIPFKN